MQHCECNTMEPIGRPIVYWPGWQQFPARASPQTDVNPLPIMPQHYRIWTFMQPQLSNGWQETNYGKRAPYDYYLRMLASSTSSPGNPRPMLGQGQSPTGQAIPSAVQLQRSISANAPPTTQNQTGGSGILAPGVNLNGRTFYG